MIIELYKAIGVEFLSYAKQNRGRLSSAQIQALQKYGQDDRVLRIMSQTLFREYDEQKEGISGSRKPITFHGWTRKSILAIVEKFEGGEEDGHN